MVTVSPAVVPESKVIVAPFSEFPLVALTVNVGVDVTPLELNILTLISESAKNGYG